MSDLNNDMHYREWSVEPEDTAAQISLGRRYLHGEGVSKDYLRAVELFHQAATNSAPEAESLLGYCHEKGYGVVKDLGKALEHYYKAAAQGYSSAIYQLGRFYEYGVRVSADFSKAQKLYKQAAKQEIGATIALHRLRSYEQLKNDHHGTRSYLEIDLPNLASSDRIDIELTILPAPHVHELGAALDLRKQYDIALKCYQQCLSAADFISIPANTRADIKRAEYFRNQRSTSDYFSVLASCDHLQILPDHTMRLYIPAGQKGYSSAEKQALVDCVHKWTSVMSDPFKVVLVSNQKQANLWFVPVEEEMFDGTAAARTCGTGKYGRQFLGKREQCYVQLPTRRIASEDDLTNAISIYMHEIGHALGFGVHSIFADDIMSGQSHHLVTPSPREINALNSLYKVGAEDEIVTILKNEVAANNPYALTRLGTHHMANCHHEQAVELLSRASKLGDANAQVSLGWYYFKKRDHTKSAELFKLATAQGDARAHYYLALCHFGGFGVEANNKKAYELMQVAASNGVVIAALQLGLLYTIGMPDLPKNHEKADRLFRNSIASGSLVASFLRGLNSLVNFVDQFLSNKKAV